MRSLACCYVKNSYFLSELLSSAANGHLSECPSKKIQIWLSRLCKWLSVTCMSDFWNFIECAGKALIQVLSLTGSFNFVAEGSFALQEL